METYAEYLEHYGVKGMRWGVIRKQDVGNSLTLKEERRNLSRDRKSLKLKRNIAFGIIGVASILTLYGGYKFTQKVRDENVKIAIEKGKKFAQNMKQIDAGFIKKYPDLFKEKPNSYYEQYIKEYADKARSEKFSEAFKNVKTVRNETRKRYSEHKKKINDIKKVVKKIKSGKYDFFTLFHLNALANGNQDILKDLGVSIINGFVYIDGKKL